MNVGGGLYDRREPGPARGRGSPWLSLVQDAMIATLLTVGALLLSRVIGIVLLLLACLLAALVGGIWIGYTGRGNEDFNKTIGRWLS